MKIGKENLPYAVGIIIWIIILIILSVYMLPFMQKGEVGILLALAVSLFAGWLAGFLAYTIALLSSPEKNKDGRDYPYLKFFYWRNSA